jgi:hypothetical protein
MVATQDAVSAAWQLQKAESVSLAYNIWGQKIMTIHMEITQVKTNLSQAPNGLFPQLLRAL